MSSSQTFLSKRARRLKNLVYTKSKKVETKKMRRKGRAGKVVGQQHTGVEYHKGKMITSKKGTSREKSHMEKGVQ